MPPTKRKGCKRTFQLRDEPDDVNNASEYGGDFVQNSQTWDIDISDISVPLQVPVFQQTVSPLIEPCRELRTALPRPPITQVYNRRTKDAISGEGQNGMSTPSPAPVIAEHQGVGTLEHTIKKKVRGPTYMTKVWGRPKGKEPEKIITNSLGQPIGPTKSTFVEFLGTIARNGYHAPIHIKSWHNVPREKEEEMLAIVKENFDVPPGMDYWILQTLGHRWRNWKNHLKAKYFDGNIPINFQQQTDEERILEDQWKKLIAYWITDEAKCISSRNKEIRKKKTMHHRTGKKSFAQVGTVLEKADKDKKPPSRVQMFKACYLDKNKNANCNDVANVVKEMDERTTQLPPGTLDEIGPNDVFAQVRGKERDGRVRMLGGGVAPSDIWGHFPSRGSSYRLAMDYKAAWEMSEERYSELMARMMMLQEMVTELRGNGSQNTSSASDTVTD